MLRGHLIHPPILEALAGAGHGSRVLIADSNYPVSTTRGPNAKLVHLNLAPGLIDGAAVLGALLTVLPVESASVMDVPPGGGQPKPAIWEDYATALQEVGVHDLDRLSRRDFYLAARGEDVAIVIATGETRLYANLLLTIGVVAGESALINGQSGDVTLP